MKPRRAGAEAAPASGAAASAFAARVMRWQRRYGRHDLPWQGTRDPYLVWLAEVMLQQTQVATVLGYYARFVERFPDVRTLAAAPLADVLARWSGLGYYSRARNLHRCAQAVVDLHRAEFPRTSVELQRLPGIGRSTAAAIAAFCFGERAAILDGNVRRVLARWLGFDGDLARGGAARELWQRAEELMPRRAIEVYTQGLMDLGAGVCLPRRPACERCPLAADCVARAEGRPHEYPRKERRARRGRREHWWLWLEHGGRWWLVPRPPRGVWGGLWSLPEFESEEALLAQRAGWPGRGTPLPNIEHALTHFDWTLHPLHWVLPARPRRAPAPLPGGDAGGRWFSSDEALALGLPAPLRRLLSAA